MSQKYSTASAPVADSGPGSALGIRAFDTRQTILSQYANSPVLLALLKRLGSALDQGANIETFYRNVWDLRTASGFGLDVWGRIVGVSRVLHLPDPNVQYFGWTSDPNEQNFGHGIWAGRGASTTNYSLADDAFRRLIFAKAALNITDGSIPAINRALMTLFPDHGNCYVRDDGGMAMTYVFGAPLSTLELAIVSQSGVLPKPVGVSVTSLVAA